MVVKGNKINVDAQRLATVLAVAIFALVVTGAVFCWPYGDDYLYKVQMQGISPVKFIFKLYMDHDGRHLSPFGFIQLHLIKYFSPTPAILLYLVAFTLSCWLIFKLILIDLGLTIVYRWQLFIVFAAVLLFCLWPLYKDVLYWLTGGAYMFALLQCTVLIYLLEAFLRNVNWTKHLPVIFFGVISFLLALNTQNIMLPVLCWIVFRWRFLFSVNKPIALHVMVYFILPVIIAMLVTSIAPGNFHRIEREQLSIDYELLEFLKSTILLFTKFITYSKWPILGGFVFGLLLWGRYLCRESTIRMMDKFYFSRICRISILAVLSIIPFVMTPALARIRVYFFGMIFLFIAAVYLGIWLGRVISHVTFKFQPIPIVVLLLYGIIFLGRQLDLMMQFSKEVSIRKEFLESKRGTSDIVYYRRLELPDDLHLIRWADYKQYGNWDRVQEYFELGGYVEIE